MASQDPSLTYKCDLSGSPVWGSDIVFLSIGLDDHSLIILRYFQAVIYLIYKGQELSQVRGDLFW